MQKNIPIFYYNGFNTPTATDFTLLLQKKLINQLRFYTGYL